MAETITDEASAVTAHFKHMQFFAAAERMTKALRNVGARSIDWDEDSDGSLSCEVKIKGHKCTVRVHTK